jgi:hypothetical protein
MSTTQKRTTKKSTVAKPMRSSARYRSASKGTFIQVRFRKPAPEWEANLENNLIEEGFTRAKARKLVRLAAS